MISFHERLARGACACLVVCLMAITASVRAQGEPPPFKPEELEALVAPIALYPDSVLSQVLMASTYPLEIVHAARWVKSNPKVKGDAAVKAVQDQPWDVSVKSMVAFPQILEPMNDKLDWTQKLGDAFLAQEKDVFAAVQRLRAQAQKSGNLKSNEQQKVIVEQPAAAAQGATSTIVRIEPTNPEVIYVPSYNPAVVYGSWAYPAAPPYYWPPYPAYYPGAALATGLAWGVGLAAAGAIFSDCNWGGGDVNIDVNRATNIDRSFDRTKVEGGKWKHDASHRQGVAYRDNASREKFGRSGVGGAEGRNGFRGREGAGTDRAGTSDRSRGGNRADAGGNRASTGDRAGGGAGRPGTSDRVQGGDRAGAADRGNGGARASTGARDNAFQGVERGNTAQRDADRGRGSMQSSAAGRGGGAGGGFSGAGGHAGGGFGGGGGRGGGGGGGGGRGGRR